MKRQERKHNYLDHPSHPRKLHTGWFGHVIRIAAICCYACQGRTKKGLQGNLTQSTHSLDVSSNVLNHVKGQAGKNSVE